MQRHSKPVAPQHLGIIGAEHFKERFLAAGGAVDTFKYQCRKGIDDDGIPYVIEFAFGLHQTGLDGSARVSREIRHRRQLERRDQQPVPPVRNTGEGLESTLAKVRANANAAGDLRAAPGLGSHPVRRPRQKLDHPRRRSGAAR